MAVIILALSSCTTMEQPSSASGADGDAVGASADVLATDPQNVAKGQSTEVPNQSAQVLPSYVESAPTLYRGTDEVIRMPQEQTPVRFFGDAVSLNFEQAPLTEVVHAIMGDILELNYIVEHPINGKVTLRTRTPVPRDQLFDILESLLQANGALMVRDGDGRFFISASGQMRQLKPSVAASAAGVVGFSTIVVPLQFISAKNMAEILAPVADEDAFVRIDDLRNLLMLAGSRAQLQGWQEIITTFDVDLLKSMSVGIFPIENTSLEEIEEALSTLMGKEDGGLAEGLAGIGSVVRILPVERLNSIMVVTPRAHYLERIELWIKRLDQAPDKNFELSLHVYPVQNTNASHLADLLSTIFGGSGKGGGRAAKAGVAPGLTPETVSASGGGAGAGGRSSSPSSVVAGDVRVVADEENNSLLIYATGKEYRKIQSALERLDIAPTQVIIEASIIEVTLNDDLRYGLEWSLNGGLGGSYEGTARLIEGRAVAPKVPGFSYSVINGAGDIRVVLNALASENLLNVISSPSVMVLDNQTAVIQVGDQIPIETGNTVTDGGNTITSIQYKDTGVHLEVTPSVNAGGMVTMDIDQSVTDVGPVDTDGAGERTFLERKINSRVSVKSSESVVLGGLIRENKSSGSSGIPLLHNLPFIGALFGTKVIEDSRTELLVIITPRVIYSESDLRDVSREMRSQMQGLDLIDVSRSSFLMD
jgi:general secretion pathway protein D